MCPRRFNTKGNVTKHEHQCELMIVDVFNCFIRATQMAFVSRQPKTTPYGWYQIGVLRGSSPYKKIKKIVDMTPRTNVNRGARLSLSLKINLATRYLWLFLRFVFWGLPEGPSRSWSAESPVTLGNITQQYTLHGH